MADSTALCGFCDKSPASWTCDWCALIFCDLCNNTFHAKIKHHVPRDLRAQQTDAKVNLTKMNCSLHSENTCNSYCRNCEHALCSACVIHTHQTEELNDILNEKIKILTELKSKVEDTLPFFLEKAKEFETMESEGLKIYNEIKEKIYTRKNHLKDKVEEEAKQVLDVLNFFWNTQDNPITQEKDRLQTTVIDLTTRKQKIEDALDPRSPEEIFQTVDKVDKHVPLQTALSAEVPTLMFTESEVEETSFKSRFGLLMKSPSLEITDTCDIDLPEIAGIVTLDDNKSVIFSAKTKLIFKHFIISYTAIIPSKEINPIIQSQYRTPGTVSMTSYKDNILFTLSGSIDEVLLYDIPRITKFTNYDSIKVVSVHYNNNEIFVGYKLPYPAQISGIMVLDSKSRNIKRKIEFECKFKLFTYPAKIVTNINDDILVIDYDTSTKLGGVVALGKWGQPKWKYQGEQNTEMKVRFSPLDIVTTRSGLVLVADKETSAIHVLSENGKLIIQFGREHGIFRPVSLNMNNYGRLLIGCSCDDSEDSELQLCLTKLHV